MKVRKGALTYNDALVLLGAGHGGVVEVLNKITGLVAAGTMITSVGALDLFAARDELVSWGNLIGASLRERLSGLSHLDRTERIEAAHAVLVITAFYEALGKELFDSEGFDARRLALTKAEQASILAGGAPQGEYSAMMQSLILSPIPVLAPYRPYEAMLRELRDFYSGVAWKVREFLRGLAVFEQDSHLADAMEAALQGVALEATSRYEIGFRRLAVDAPEFGVWASVIDGQATRISVASIQEQLGMLCESIAAIREFGDTTAGQCLRTLAIRYQRRLSRPVLDNSPRSGGIHFPTLGEAYVAPQCRIGDSGTLGAAGFEPWWRDKPSAPDAVAFVMAHALTDRALRAPLVVLGQPGSGKSVLTQVLAARMAGTQLVPVRVELRSVPADRGTGIQEQVERSLLQSTGEHVTWPELCRAAAGMTPVIFLDGLDELPQAGIVDQGDYLERVKDFQEREAEAGRPVCVIVTTRISVADRFRYPADAVVARLEPFDEARISQWLAIWNAANVGGPRLSPELITPYGAFANQPLLLLLLAIHLTDESIAKEAATPQTTAQLYDELFKGFLFREARRRAPELSEFAWWEMVEGELERLGVVAFGIFNRRRESATEKELDADLNASARTQGDVHADSAEVQPARDLANHFFFMYEAMAPHSDGRASRSYEFVHPTFGEFLLARLAIRLTVEVATDAGAKSRDLDDGSAGNMQNLTLLRGILSFRVLCAREPIVEFCAGLYSLLSDAIREQCQQFVSDEFGGSLWLESSAMLREYQPALVAPATRAAVYSANLLLLLVLATDAEVDAAKLVGIDNTDRMWRRSALLWESQLAPEEWRSLWGTLRVVAVWGDAREDAERIESEFWYGQKMIHVRREDNTPIELWDALPDFIDSSGPEEHLPVLSQSVWTNVSAPPESALGRALREAVFRSDDSWIRDVLGVIAPLWERTGDGAMWRVQDNGVFAPALRSVTQLLLGRMSGGSPAEASMRSKEMYVLAFRSEAMKGSERANLRFLDLLFRLLVSDAHWMKPSDVQASLRAVLDSRRRPDGELGGLEADYGNVVRVLAQRADVAREFIESLLHPFSWDDLDTLDADFDSGLSDLRRELGFSD